MRQRPGHPGRDSSDGGSRMTRLCRRRGCRHPRDAHQHHNGASYCAFWPECGCLRFLRPRSWKSAATREGG